MKEPNLKKAGILKRWFYSLLVIPFKRALRIIDDESEFSEDFQVSMKGVPNTFLTYDRHQRISSQLLEMERHKAEAMQSMRKVNRYI